MLMRSSRASSAKHAITELKELTSYAEPKTYESNNQKMNNTNDGVRFGSYGLILGPAFPSSLVACFSVLQVTGKHVQPLMHKKPWGG